MDKVPDYKFRDDLFDQKDTCPIEILNGDFSGIVFKYGKISLHETESGELAVNMNVTTLQAPENFNQETPEFTQVVGQIFTDIVEKNIEEEKKEVVDLEDDVHQD
jgi:hypothetical protein